MARHRICSGTTKSQEPSKYKWQCTGVSSHVFSRQPAGLQAGAAAVASRWEIDPLLRAKHTLPPPTRSVDRQPQCRQRCRESALPSARPENRQENKHEKRADADIRRTIPTHVSFAVSRERTWTTGNNKLRGEQMQGFHGASASDSTEPQQRTYRIADKGQDGKNSLMIFELPCEKDFLPHERRQGVLQMLQNRCVSMRRHGLLSFPVPSRRRNAAAHDSCEGCLRSAITAVPQRQEEPCRSRPSFLQQPPEVAAVGEPASFSQAPVCRLKTRSSSSQSVGAEDKQQERKKQCSFAVLLRRPSLLPLCRRRRRLSPVDLALAARAGTLLPPPSAPCKGNTAAAPAHRGDPNGRQIRLAKPFWRQTVSWPGGGAIHGQVKGTLSKNFGPKLQQKKREKKAGPWNWPRPLMTGGGRGEG